MFVLGIIVKIIFGASLIGMLVIFYMKTPLLANLPKTSPVFETKKKILINLLETTKEKIKNRIPSEILLQKILSKIKVFTLRTENKISGWLEFLRTRAKKNNTNNVKDDKYWEKLEEKKEK